MLLSYLDEEGDAKAAAASIEEAGRQAVRLPGDISQPAHCRELVKAAVDRFGRLDILVNNGAYQATHKTLDYISDDEWEKTFATNIHAQFYLSKAAVPHMAPGSSIINTSSVNAKHTWAARANRPNSSVPTSASRRTTPSYTTGALLSVRGGMAIYRREKSSENGARP